MEHQTAGSREAVDADILRIVDLTKTYGRFSALKSVSLSVRRGTIHGLLGENGAGKSTLVGMISGQREPTSGTILLDGAEVQGHDVTAMEKAASSW